MRQLASIFILTAAISLATTFCRADARFDTDGGSFSFQTSILPILTKAGCNAGACHGAAPGAGGFKLSLLGYDPADDYERITREFGGRRIDLDRPAHSLFLQKPAGQIEHEGGRKLPRNDDDYKTLLKWIAQGASSGRADLNVTSITVEPADVLFPPTETNVQITVTARLSNGMWQDVTSLALFDSNNDGIAQVDKGGRMKMTAPGATSIMVRYGGQVAAVRVALPFRISQPAPGLANATNIVDAGVFAECSRLGLVPTQESSDSEFLRRIYLDLAGTLPPMETARLVAETGQLDRTSLTKQLLGSDAFNDLWTMHLADLLQVGGSKANPSAAKAYHLGLRARVKENAPLNHVVSELLTAKGKLAENGPANFYTLARDPRDTAEHVSRIFLGTQLACARCHAHPTDRWTQNDYYSFAAFFTGVSQDAGEISLKSGNEILHPKTRQPAKAKPLGEASFEQLELDPRHNLAQWISSSGNPFFARSMVNRIWKKLMGRGLVEPVDDLRPTNPATHPHLLDDLAAQFASHNYDLRKLIEIIVSSQTYQLSSTSNKPGNPDGGFYSHAYVKPLPAAVLLDAINDVTGQSEAFESHPAGTRSVQLIGSIDQSHSLDLLGRCQREKPCDSSIQGGGGLAQALHLLNGATVNGKLQGGRILALAESNKSVPAIVEEVYLTSFARLPSREESAYWNDFFTQAATRSEAVEDLHWVLLNSREFTFNH